MEELRVSSMEEKMESSTISFRITCSETGNGLSHYIMYGDMPEEDESR
jgi:hypothetical protein